MQHAQCMIATIGWCRLHTQHIPSRTHIQNRLNRETETKLRMHECSNAFPHRIASHRIASHRIASHRIAPFHTCCKSTKFVQNYDARERERESERRNHPSSTKKPLRFKMWQHAHIMHIHSSRFSVNANAVVH
eukprot:jgi/Psemu1/300697/fgenesh1_kg.16_\